MDYFSLCCVLCFQQPSKCHFGPLVIFQMVKEGEIVSPFFAQINVFFSEK